VIHAGPPPSPTLGVYPARGVGQVNDGWTYVLQQTPVQLTTDGFGIKCPTPGGRPVLLVRITERHDRLKVFGRQG
jgi:hypothetical protein